MVAIIVAAAVGIMIWQRGDEPAEAPPTAEATATSGGAPGPRDRDPGRGAWFGQANVGGRRIAGVVVGEDGAPVAGATVRLASGLTKSGLRPEPSALSDGSGRFDFGAQPATAHVVVAEKPGLTGAIAWVDVRDATVRPPPDQLRLVLHPCIASIHGTIRDGAGGVIAGALVTRGDRRLATKVGAEADAQGSYQLCVPPGGASVIVQADGYAALVDRVNVFGRTRRDFDLMPGTSVIGRVVRAGDRAPVAGAMIEMRSASPQDSAALLAAASDEDGRFQVDGVAPGRYELHAKGERLASPRPVQVIAEIGVPPVEIVCEVAPALQVSGKVLEREDQAPVVGTTVRLVTRTPMGLRLEAITQPDGSFVIDHVLPGVYIPYLDSYQRGDQQPPDVKVETTDVSGVVLEVERRATISGRILYEGKPVHGARVRAADSYVWAESDHAGRYTLRGLEPNTYRIYAESHRIGAFSQGPSATVASGEHRTNVDVELDLAGSISGVVVDQHDAPLGGVFLAFSLLHGRDFGAATTADDGTFTARALSGGGEYLFEVRPRDGSPVVYPPIAGKRHPPVAVRDGRTRVTGVRIKVRVERLVIGGRITDGAGQPVPDVVVRAITRDHRGYRTPIGTSDESGAFTIRDLQRGTYSLQATSTRGDASEEDVAAGRTDVALVLAGRGGIDGTLEGFADTPEVFALHDRGGGRYRAVVAGTTFQFRNLSVGRYRVMAMSPTGGASAQVAVSSGETKQLVLRRPEFGTIAGIVVDEETRAPIAGLRCSSHLRGGQGAWSYAGPAPATSDANGAFRIERAAAGANNVACWQPGLSASGSVTVQAGQVARVELVAKRRAERRAGHAGMTLETQLGDVMVKTVEPDGPAARAGIAVGDVVVKVDDRAFTSVDSDMLLRLIELHTESPVKLVLERGDKQLTVQLTVEAAP